jgi:hypothetical protein
MTRSPTPWENSAASRDRRDRPITIWVALTPTENSRMAAATSSPTAVWKVPPRDSTSVRWATSLVTSWAGEPPTTPSPRAT